MGNTGGIRQPARFLRPRGTTDHSPPFQRWGSAWGEVPSPAGAKEDLCSIRRVLSSRTGLVVAWDSVTQPSMAGLCSGTPNAKLRVWGPSFALSGCSSRPVCGLLATYLVRSSAPRIPGRSVGHDHVPATVEKTKYLVSGESFIPLAARIYAIQQPRARTEFRHDSCNTAPR